MAGRADSGTRIGMRPRSCRCAEVAETLFWKRVEVDGEPDGRLSCIDRFRAIARSGGNKQVAPFFATVWEWEAPPSNSSPSEPDTLDCDTARGKKLGEQLVWDGAGDMIEDVSLLLFSTI